jgi:hypothetical protein
MLSICDGRAVNDIIGAHDRVIGDEAKYNEPSRQWESRSHLGESVFNDRHFTDLN